MVFVRQFSLGRVLGDAAASGDTATAVAAGTSEAETAPGNTSGDDRAPAVATPQSESLRR